MEILQVTKDRIEQSSNRFTTLFVVIFIAFPVVIIVNLMYSNTSFSLFEDFTKGKVLLVGEIENVQNITNVTTNGGRVHKISDGGNIKGDFNNTMSKVCNMSYLINLHNLYCEPIIAQN